MTTMGPTPTLRVLVIEDDSDTRANLRDILSLDGHDVVTATTAAEALARDDWPGYDVLLMDWRLPDATGEQLLPQLRARAPDASIIVSTGIGGMEEAIVALRHGAADYIAKPVDADLLRASLRRVGQQRRLQQEKARSEAAFRSLVEAAGSVIVILTPGGDISYINPFGEQLTGYRASDVRGRNCVDLLVPAEHRHSAGEHIAGVLDGRPERGYELPLCDREGSVHWLLWNIQRLEDFGGQPAVLAIGQDVTARKQAEERLLQNERLAAIGQAMTGLAHESRNALQRGQADLELLALMVQNQPEARRLVERLQRVQQDLHHLYEEVRQYAAPLTLAIEPYDLRQLVREAWELIGHIRQGRTAWLEVSGAADSVCRIDRFQMLQAFRNIFENALAAARDPVQIEVTLRDECDNGQPWLVVAVRDNGPGFPPGLSRTAFDAFITTKTRGTGLGLAIVRRIVEAHRGRVWIGRPRQGAEVVLELPRDGDWPQATATSA